MRLRLPVLLLLMTMCTGSVAHADLYRWFKLDTDTGDTAVDSSPNGIDGEIFDAEFVNDPVRGTVLEFDGEISWVDAGFLPLMDLENNFTWAFWENQSEFQNSPANDIILGNRWGGDGQADTAPREFIKFTPNRFEYHMNGIHDNDMTYGADDPEHIPSDDEWRHHVVVKQADTLTYYRDGELFNEHELVDPMFSEDPLPIAMGGQYGAETWAGKLSDVRLYDHALTEAEVAIVMDGGGEIEEIGYTESFSPNDDFNAEWCTSGDNVNFRVSGNVEGWVAFGFSDDQFMANSDLIMLTGEGDVQDSWAVARAAPPADASQDVTLVSASQENGTTVVEFSRPLDTGDEDDLALSSERFLLWATNANSDSFGARHIARGFSAEKIHFGNAGACTVGGDPYARLDDGSLVDPVERRDYIHDVLGTWVGDSNRDGEFSSSDLVQVFSGGVYEDAIPGNGTWDNGDWNGSGDFDTADLVYAFQDGGFELGPFVGGGVNTVPEPSSLVLIAFGMLALVRRRR